MKIVKVKWMDAEKLSGVQDISYVKEIELKEIETIGFLILDDDKKIIISQERWDEGKQIRDVSIIPKCSIKKIKELKEI